MDLGISIIERSYYINMLIENMLKKNKVENTYLDQVETQTNPNIIAIVGFLLFFSMGLYNIL